MKTSLFKRLNPMGSILLTVAGIFGLGLLSIIIVLSYPSCLGIPAKCYEVNEVYEFNRFVLDGEHINLTVNENGWLVPGYIGESVYGVVVLGDGSYSIGGETNIEGNFTSIFLPVNPETFQGLRDNLILERRYNSSIAAAAENIFSESIKNQVFTLNIFGITRIYPPSGNTATGFVKQSDGSIIQFNADLTKSGERPQHFRKYHALWQKAVTMLSILIITALLTLSVYIFTIERQHEEKHVYIALIRRISKPDWVVAGLLIAFLIISWLSQKTGTVFLNRLNDIGLAVVSFIFISRKKWHYLFHYFSLPKFISDMILGLGISVMAIFLAATELPQSVLPLTVKATAVALFSSLSREFLFRGILQTYLCHRLSNTAGLIVTPLFLGAMGLIARIGLEALGSADMIRALAVVPLTAFIPSYMFYRTHSLIAGTVFGAVICLIPPLLIFN